MTKEHYLKACSQSPDLDSSLREPWMPAGVGSLYSETKLDFPAVLCSIVTAACLHGLLHNHCMWFTGNFNVSLLIKCHWCFNTYSHTHLAPSLCYFFLNCSLIRPRSRGAWIRSNTSLIAHLHSSLLYIQSKVNVPALHIMLLWDPPEVLGVEEELECRSQKKQRVR